jgi:ATP-dependent RNA helicase DeaD
VAEKGFETYRVEVGKSHGVQPGNIVGAIANEAGIDSKHIGRIDIRDDHSLVDLPEGMPEETFQHLKKVWVTGQQLHISRAGDKPAFEKRTFEKPDFKKRGFEKHGPEKREFGKPRKSFSPKPHSSKAGGFVKPKRPPHKPPN